MYPVRMQPRPTLWMAWWLALALVLAPALGRMHGAVHVPQVATAGALAWAVSGDATADASAAHSPAVHAASGLLAAWDGHAQADCLVLDQLAHALESAAHAPLALPSMPQQRAASGARWHMHPTATAAFEARAPPRLAQA